MSKKRDYTLNPPKSKAELNKVSMLDYVEKKGSEDIEWFIATLDECKEEKTANMDFKGGKVKKGDTYKGYNVTKLRNAFVDRYFPALNEKKEKVYKDPFEKRIADLRAKINK